MIKSKKGFSILELIFSLAIMFVICLLFYKALTVSSRTMNLAGNNDETVQKSALVFSEELSRHLRYSQSSLISLYPSNGEEQGSLGFSFLYSEEHKLAKGEESIETLGFKKSYDASSLTAIDNTFNARLSKWKTAIFYFHDKEGTINPQAKNCIYQFVVKLTPSTSDYFLNKIPKSEYTPLDITTFVKNRHIRKVATNVVYFKASLENSPLVTIDATFSYGKGGSASGGSKEEQRSNLTEVFDVNTQIYPGI